MLNNLNLGVDQHKHWQSALTHGPRKGAIIFLFIILSFLTFVLVWASYAELNEVTIAQGRVVTHGRVKTIQHLDGGIITKIFTKEGDYVKKDSLLMQLSPITSQAGLDQIQARYISLKVIETRLSAEIEGKEPKYNSKTIKKYPLLVERGLQLHNIRKQQHKATIDTLKSQLLNRSEALEESRNNLKYIGSELNLARQEIELIRPLYEQGAASKVELIRLERTAINLEGSFEAAKNDIAKKKANHEEIKQKITETGLLFQSTALEELTKTRVQMKELKEQMIRQGEHLSRTDIKAPITGTVKQVFINTIGGVVAPGGNVVELVPDDEKLLIEAKLSPSDIANVYTGAKAVVRISAFDFSITGGIPATVDQIGVDTILDVKTGEAYYQVLISLDQEKLKSNDIKFKIISGMTAEVDILSGKKTVLDYFLKPVKLIKYKALREK